MGNKNNNPLIVPLKWGANERGEIQAKKIEGAKYVMSQKDILENGLKLGEVGKYSFVEREGFVYRVGENGVEFPPITKQKFEEYKKCREEALGLDSVIYQNTNTAIRRGRPKKTDTVEGRE